MNDLQRFVSAVLREGVEFREVDSPLQYSRAGNIKRLALCDSDVTEPARKHDTYFAEIERWRRRSKTGRMLKKKVLDEIIPGVADICVAGFLDYHTVGDDYWYIDYLKTRGDMRGKGYASQLVDEFFNRHAKPGVTVHFGKMMRKEVGHIKDKMAKKYPDVSVGGARNF